MNIATSNMIALLSVTFPNLTIQNLVRITNGKAGEIYLANNQIIFKVALTTDTSHSNLVLEY
ncbi:MAG: hypothetical protein FWF78_01630, partial [Defluviitaleaceae bacterium]|nr:hypothetical protein [Defluviitaleaceae bacterium]